MDSRQGQKGMVMMIVIATIAIIGIGYLLFSSTLLKTNKNSRLSDTDNNSKSVADNSTLHAACKNAISDYPEWTKVDTDLIIWENPDKSFNFRNSPEDASSKLTSPVPPTETLVDMDFIGQNEISYITTGGSGWKINTLKLNGLQPPDKLQIFEKNETVSYITISPINKSEYIVLVIKGNQTVLEKINTNGSKEEILIESPSINTDKLKLSVSPKGTYVYLLQGDSLILYEIASKKQIDKINSVKSAVWIGDEYVLYSGAEGTFIYNLETKEKSKINKIEQISELTFNPKENGIIAFNDGGNTKVVNCQTWQIINSKQGAELKTLTSEKTAITKKGDQFGYWRFKDRDWEVKILEGNSKFVTVWQRY